MNQEHLPQVHCHGDILAGRYRLLQPLAEGGMGSVWSARSIGLDVDVAVKVVKRSVASPEACERLLREARAAASLGHASIVRVLDFGTTDEGEPFLVMQLLRGKTLGGWLRERGRLPAAMAVQLLLPIASALAEVHGLGIVHRDIKPENIIFEEGQGGQVVPKLVDFGIAKQSHVDLSVFTMSGVLMGSPAYMSPEQARGDHRVDSRSDVWALCVVLYEMITGKRPFEGPNHGAILFSVFSHSPEPTHLLGGGDEALWDIVRRGLAKSTADRWQTMKQLGHALAGWAATQGVTADAAGTSLHHQWLAGEGVCPSVDLGQRTTEVPRAAVHAATAGPTDHVHTLPSSASVSEIELDAPYVRAPARSRATVVGLGLGLLVISGILTFLSLAPGSRGLVPVVIAQTETRIGADHTLAAVPDASSTPPVPTITVGAVAPDAGPAASASSASPDAGTAARPPRSSSPRPPASAVPASGNRPMPLPAGPDF